MKNEETAITYITLLEALELTGLTRKQFDQFRGMGLIRGQYFAGYGMKYDREQLLKTHSGKAKK